MNLQLTAHSACHDQAGRPARGLYTPGVMVSFSGGGGGGALSSPAGILVLLVVIAVVAGVFWLFNR